MFFTKMLKDIGKKSEKKKRKAEAKKRLEKIIESSESELITKVLNMHPRDYYGIFEEVFGKCKNRDDLSEFKDGKKIIDEVYEKNKDAIDRFKRTKDDRWFALEVIKTAVIKLESIISKGRHDEDLEGWLKKDIELFESISKPLAEILDLYAGQILMASDNQLIIKIKNENDREKTSSLIRKVFPESTSDLSYHLNEKKFTLSKLNSKELKRYIARYQTLEILDNIDVSKESKSKEDYFKVLKDSKEHYKKRGYNIGNRCLSKYEQDIIKNKLIPGFDKFVGFSSLGSPSTELENIYNNLAILINGIDPL